MSNFRLAKRIDKLTNQFIMISLKRLLASFKDAAHGVVYVYKHEQNFRIQIFISILVLAAIFYFPLRTYEIILLLLLIMTVLTIELMNTALEYFTDLLKPRIHPYVGLVKDIMAGAVLLTSLGAFIIGMIIFGPYFVSLGK